MAIVANTFTTFDDKRKRETLSDLIANIDRDETPFVSLIGSEKIDGTHPEWNIDTNATPSTSNARVQGDTYSYSALTATSRVGNYTQIMIKEGMVSETEEAQSKAGPKSEFNRQKLKKGVELKTDKEVTLLSNQASVAGAAATVPKLGGFRAWIATNDSLGSTGASGGYNTGTGLVDVATNGTQRTFTKTLLDDNMQNVVQAGGKPTILMLSPYLKRVFSTFMSDANVALNRRQVSGKDQMTITAAADEYISDFGPVTTLINFQTARADVANGNSNLTRTAFLITPDKVTCGVLRPIQEDTDVAKTSDAKPFVLKTEFTLIVKHEGAHGAICDLFGKTSAS